LCSLAKAYEPYIPDKYKADFYNYIALSESSFGLYQQSIEHYDMSLQYADSLALQRTIRMNKGFTLTEAGDYEKALEMYQPFISDTSLDDSDRFTLFNYLGRLNSFVDKEQSLRYFNMAEEYMDDPYTDNKSRYYAWMSHAVANRYLQREYLNKAIKLDTERWFGGIDTIPAGVDYTELGWFYTSNFDYSAADGCYQRAYNYLKRLTPEDKRRTTLDTYYASNLIRMQRIPEALEILNSLKNTQQRVLGSEHVEYLRTARLMLHALIAQGNSNACDSLFREYTELVNHHPNEQNEYEDLMVKTDYYRMLGRNDSIVDLLETAFQKRENAERLELLTRYASALLDTNSEQFAGRIGFISNASKETVVSNFLKLSEQDRTSWQAPLNALQNIFVSANIGNSSGIVSKEALEYNLFTKGLLFHTRNAIYKRLSRSRSTKSSVDNLKAMRDSLNIAVALGDSANTLRLADRVATLERQLSYKSVSVDELRRIFNVDMQSVLSSMGKSSLAIDFVRYTVNDTVKYGAFLLSSKMKQPLFVDVCCEQELLSMARKTDGSVSYQFYRDKTHKGTSYNMVWGQLAEHFAGYTDIYFSGDGVLNQLGIEYLTDADDVQACDRFRLHRVFHLADIRKPLTIGSEFVAVGVSDHNSPIADASTAERGGWSDLDGVVNEFNVVKSQFGQNNGKLESKFVINDDAREAYVKSLNNSSVSTLHIATHGFYMDKDGLYRAETDSVSVDHYVAHRALTVGKESLSGIILRKGNLSWKSPTITDEDDDILTSDEIENLTFPKLNLTVLSACETGLGDVDSEGVWGLQRAFRIVGTQSLICSLCRIDDKWTARFMEEFYRHAVAGETIYDSFHAARSFLFRENKKNAKVWSSMILIE
jgi:tetratricopeptide (TPR) repeat protein